MSKKLLHPSRSFYATIWGVISGVAFSTFFWHLPLSFGWLALALVLCFVVLFLPTPFTLVLAFCGGFIIANCRTTPLHTSKNFAEQLYGQEIILIGQISEAPTTDSGRSIVRLQHLQLVDNSSNPVDKVQENVENNVEKTVQNIAGTAYIQLDQTYSELERSDILTVTGSVNQGFGTFLLTMYRAKPLGVQRTTTGDPFARLKNWFANLVRDYIPSPESGLGLGYLMGMKSDLSDSLSETLQLVGMTHVIVASGAHLGILVNGARRIFGRISRFAGLFCSIFLIFTFVSIVGFTPSMTRASLVSILSLSFGYLGRRFTPFRLLSLTAAITLLIDPTNLINLGWQLSFASFSGLLILSPRFTRLFYGGKSPPWLASMLITSLSTTIACAPILIYNFGSISLLAFVANLIILPTLPYAMLLVALTGVTSFLPILATLIAKLTTLLLDLHIAIVTFLSTKSMFILELQSGSLYIFLFYLPLITYLIFPQIKKTLHPSLYRP